MKWNRKALVVLLLALPVVAACRQDMHNQPKYTPLRASAFFGDGSSARPLVEGTVARGLLHEDEAFYTGRVGGALVREMPVPVDHTLLARGRERYDIFCAPCHDATGAGNGMIVQRGYRQPPPMHDDRLREAEAGHFFDVMTNGFGAMPDYRQQVSPRDRWAIVAYVRALQLSQAGAQAPGAGSPAGGRGGGAPSGQAVPGQGSR
jgi:mono/diheme cytochrome c family protein